MVGPSNLPLLYNLASIQQPDNDPLHLSSSRYPKSQKDELFNLRALAYFL
jgi:hypothetical protein